MEPVSVDKSTSPPPRRSGSGSGSSSNTTTSTNLRWVPTKEQKEILEDLYSNGLRTPSAEQIEDITRRLKTYGHIEGKNVFYWFQNHKARLRLKQKQQVMSMMMTTTNHPPPAAAAAAASGFNIHKGNNSTTNLRLPVHQSVAPAPHLLPPKIYSPNGYYMLPQLDHHHHHQMGRSYYNIHQQQQQSPYVYNTHSYYTGVSTTTTDVKSTTFSKMTHLRKKRNNYLNMENRTLDLFPLHPTAEGRCGAGNSVTSTTTSSHRDLHHHHVNCYDFSTMWETSGSSTPTERFR